MFMSVFISDKDKAKLCPIFKTKMTPNLNISARVKNLYQRF